MKTFNFVEVAVIQAAAKKTMEIISSQRRRLDRGQKLHEIFEINDAIDTMKNSCINLLLLASNDDEERRRGVDYFEFQTNG